jgi:hypothetical protein
MRAAVAFVLTVTVLGAGCFPKNAQYQTYAKLSEGALVVGGIGMLLAVNSGADCDMKSMPGGQPDDDCKSKANFLGGIGLGMILVGLVGFIATVSTAEDEADSKAAPIIVKPAPEKPAPAPAPAPAPPAEPAPAEPATPPAS